MADARRKLAAALLDDAGQETLARRLTELPPGQSAQVVLAADGSRLALPVELQRLALAGAEVGPLGRSSLRTRTAPR